MYLSLISAYKIDHLINIIGITVAHTRQTIKFNVTNVVAISPGKKMPLLRYLNGVIPISLNYCPLVLVKIPQGVALNPNREYCSIKRLALIYFSCAQEDHKLNETGITI